MGMVCTFLNAQRTVEKSLPLDPGGEVILKFNFAEQIDLKTWDKNEVQVNVRVDINENQDNDRYTLIAIQTFDGVNLPYSNDNFD